MINFNIIQVLLDLINNQKPGTSSWLPEFHVKHNSFSGFFVHLKAFITCKGISFKMTLKT